MPKRPTANSATDQQATDATSSLSFSFSRVVSPPNPANVVSSLSCVHRAADFNQRGVVCLANGDFYSAFDYFDKAMLMFDHFVKNFKFPSEKRRRLNEFGGSSESTCNVISTNNTHDASTKSQPQTQNKDNVKIDNNTNNNTLSFDGSFVSIPVYCSDEQWFRPFNKAVTFIPDAKNCIRLIDVPLYSTIILFNIALCYHVTALSLLPSSRRLAQPLLQQESNSSSNGARTSNQQHRAVDIQQILQKAALYYNRCSSFFRMYKLHTSSTLIILAGAINNEAQIYYEDLTAATIEDDELGTKAKRRYNHHKNLMEQLYILVKMEIFSGDRLGDDNRKVKENFLINITISRCISHIARSA